MSLKVIVYGGGGKGIVCKFGICLRYLFIDDFFFMEERFVVFSERYVFLKVKFERSDSK